MSSTPTPDDLRIIAQLKKPGIGMSWPRRMFNRFVTKPLFIRKATWDESEQRFLKAHDKLLKELKSFSRADYTRRALVPPQIGLEDSSRYWSAAMVARHLVIVGQAMEFAIVELSQGRPVAYKVDTAKVKPEHERNDLLTLAEYESFGNDLVSRLRARVGDKKSKAELSHPWFGPMRAHEWMWLMGIHTGVHLKQLRAIKLSLAAGTESL